MKNFMLILSFVALIFGCENLAVLPDTGTVEGKVSISPLCGNISIVTNTLNPCGFTDEQIDQIYSKYKVSINGVVSGKIVTKEYVLNKAGVFTFEVPVGAYKIEVILPDGSTNQTGIVLQNNLKKDIMILKNQVTKVDFEVNTGIR